MNHLEIMNPLVASQELFVSESDLAEAHPVHPRVPPAAFVLNNIFTATT